MGHTYLPAQGSSCVQRAASTRGGSWQSCLANHCQQDAVIYSDDAGQTWHLSRTRLPDNGEAQLAEVGVDEVLFDGRSDKGSYDRGVALSTDAGETFGAVRFADDASSGVSCLASLIALPLTPTTPKATLLFSHPAAKNRSGGVLLRSVDGAASWTKVGTATQRSQRKLWLFVPNAVVWIQPASAARLGSHCRRGTGGHNVRNGGLELHGVHVCLPHHVPRLTVPTARGVVV